METSGVGRSSMLVAASFLVLALVSCCMNTGAEDAPEFFCLVNEQCGVGLQCSGGMCVGCGDAASCPFGTYCSYGDGDILNSCRLSKSNGASCCSNEECASWHCQNSTSTCEEGRSSNECYTGICNGGVCAECTRHGYECARLYAFVGCIHCSCLVGLLVFHRLCSSVTCSYMLINLLHCRRATLHCMHAHRSVTCIDFPGTRRSLATSPYDSVFSLVVVLVIVQQELF